MSARPDAAAQPAEPELVITRVFDAPPGLVFKAWTKPEHFVRWWGPKGFTTPFCTIDLRPGGVWHVCMRSPDGRDYWSKGVYREIVVPERIVSTDFFSDEAGNPVQPAHYGLPADWPAEMLLTVTFAEQAGKTRLTVRQSVPESLARSIGAVEGWNQSFDRLAEQLANA
jgi:uncharacterized protein YndB with AHSA1/START domain